MSTNKEIYTNLLDLAALSCAHKGLWGVYCSWGIDVEDGEYESRVNYIRGCLPPEEFAEVNLPYDGWFLRLFVDESAARSYYSQCRGNNDRIYDGVFATLIDSAGSFRTANT